MADSTVAALTASDALTGTELFYADGFASAVAADVKVTAAQIKTWATSGAIAHTSLALGGATIGSNALAVTGTAAISGGFTLGGNASLFGDAANTLDLRNGVNAQAINIYNTWTDASNYERLGISWSANVLTIGTVGAGTGVSRTMKIFAGANGSELEFGVGGAAQWKINNSGHFLATTDNTYDIGASGATRPRTIYVATSIVNAGGYVGSGSIEIGATGDVYWNSRSVLKSPSDGVIGLYNNAGTDFGRLQFGGTTSPFPALKRSTTRLQHVLADDSAYAGVDASDIGLIGASGDKIDILRLSEETTIAAAATTDTTIQIPANAILLAVQVRTTTVIPTAATYTVIGAGSATAFNTAAVSTAAMSTDPGTKAGAYYNATAQAIRITPNATPADNTGRVRVTIRYILSTPPTS
jgi:hypothetical protein